MFQLRTVALLALCAQPLFGGVVLDGSFGTHGALPGPNYMISANFGRQVGANLFQSFSQFNLISSESATFSGPNTIHDILARVTSGSASSIDGLVRSDIAGANLFLLNPAGVLFGAHAQIDVSGSFAVSTANYLKLADGGKFNTSLGGRDVLTSAPVTAFGFLSSAPAPVSVAGSTLNVAPQKSFSVVAGNITMNGGTITGAGSRVNLVSVKSPGEVALDATNINSTVDVTEFTAMGDIDLANLAKIDTSGSDGGPVVIRGGNFNLNNSEVSSETTGGSNGLAFDVALSGELDVVNSASIFTNTLGSANGGNLSIHAGSLSIDGSASPGLFTGIAAQTSGGATGNAGRLAITVDHALRIVAEGEIVDSTFSGGNGGNLIIHAGSLLIDGSALPSAFTGIFATSHPGATGNAGNLTVVANQALTITGSGEISGATLSSGNGGNLSIQAGSLSIDGSATPDLFTGIGVTSNSGATGDAGDLTIAVDHALTLTGRGQISASTFSPGNGGNLTIHAGSLSIDGSATPDQFTGIGADSSSGATGDAGNVAITVNQGLRVVGRGEIETSTFSRGNGGNLTIHAGSLSIDGSATPDRFTGITADSNPGATGNAGDLTVSVDQALSVVGRGQISADTFSSGAGGNLSIHAGSLSIDGSATPDQFTGVAAQTQGTGNAGGLNLIVDRALSVTATGQISASTFSGGNGGNLTIHAGSLSVDGSATPDHFTGITADSNVGATGRAGELTVSVDQELSVVGRGQISADTFSSGTGGDLTIHAGSLSIDGSATPDRFTGIATQAQGSGNAGNLNLVVDRALSLAASGEISASTFSGGNGGNLTIHAGSLSIDGSATPDKITGIVADSKEGATGNAGDLTILVDQALRVFGSGQITADTYSSGQGGNLNIRAGSMLIDGSASPDFFTGISADAVQGTGNAGDLMVSVASLLTIKGSGEIAVTTFTSGHGGNLSIHAGSLSIDGSATPTQFTGIFADAADGTGNGGDLAVTVDGALTIKASGEISAGTSTSGKGGNLSLYAGSLSIDGSETPTFFTGIASEADGGTGNAGDLTITVQGLLGIKGSGAISASTYTSGQGGNLSIHAGSLSIDGSAAPGQITGIIADSEEGATGNAGDLTIVVDQALKVVGSGQITADTYSPGKGGSLSVHAGSMLIDGSASHGFFTGISADAVDSTGDAGDLMVTVDGLLAIKGGEISASTDTSGKGGDLSIHAGSLSINGSAAPGQFTGVFTQTQGTGNAGGLNLIVDRALSVVGSGQISASTFSPGNGGNLTIHAGSLSIDGSATPDQFTGITADSNAGATGNAGELIVTVDQALSVVGRGQISADTFSSGTGGNLVIHAGSLSIDGSATPDQFTGIATQTKGGGNAGDLSLIVDRALSVVARGQISASTFSGGNGGNLTIHAGSLSIDGSATPGRFTGIDADSSRGATGNAGDLNVNVDAVLSITGSGEISADTFSSGKGGDLSVSASSLLIDGMGSTGLTGISAEAAAGTGSGGEVVIRADNLVMQDRGTVSAKSVTSATAGSVRLALGTLSIDSNSSISSANTGTGTAGSVLIDATGPVKLRHGSSISTLAEVGDAGSIELSSGEMIRLRDGSSITASAGANGGNITISAPDLVYLIDSQITATAGRNGRNGKGGNITIDPQFIVLNNSLISANAAAGQGGNINLVSDFFFNSNSLITATGITNGTVNISAPPLDLGAELITLPISLLSAENQLQERCTALLQGDFSSFISIGRGGTEPEPDELQEEF